VKDQFQFIFEGEGTGGNVLTFSYHFVDKVKLFWVDGSRVYPEVETVGRQDI
jgi:hypothetical protein